MYFTITTNKEVALEIEKQCEFDARLNHRSYVLGSVNHYPGYSIVQLKPKDILILPEDIFWLGRNSNPAK